MSHFQFHDATRGWFDGEFPQPTEAQAAAWPVIGGGDHCLLLAPTGSGKTLAAFLAAIDGLMFPRSRKALEPTDGESNGRVSGVKVLYISPLKALGVDIQRNLRSPIAGIRATAERMELDYHLPTIGVRTGDTPSRDRQQLNRQPPDILITTPESLYLLLTSQARKILPTIDTLIIDEIHSLVGNKRGAHLFLSLERLEAYRQQQRPSAPVMQRIGLSATQRPLEEIARLLGGAECRRGELVPRRVQIVESSRNRRLDLTVEVPVEDMSRMAESQPPADGDDPTAPIPSIWPAIHAQLVERIRQHRSTMIFVNSRRLAERMAAAINECAESELALAHHGSIAKDTRLQIEDRLKRGELAAIVATSSLELGIDMGAVDLVIQIESPPTIASGIQRIGRAGHQVDATSKGVIYPKFRGDLLSCSAAVANMQAGFVEATYYPRNPLDVLAQQITAMASLEPVAVDEVFATVRQAAPFHDLQRSTFEGVLDLLAGRYPSDEFAELRPRVVWDRLAGTIGPRRGTQRMAIVNAGTIPDRGLYGVYLASGANNSRIGELDEEMVFETRPGEVFLLGASSWRVIEITHDRVLVEPAPGEPGRMPFWRGDGPGRPLDFGEAIGRLARELLALDSQSAMRRLTDTHGLDAQAAANLLEYLHEQREATGEIPTDRSVVIESFLDEIGDWRVAILSPFGARVHAPWATVVAARLREEMAGDVDLMWTDDGLLFRIPRVGDAPPPAEWFLPSADELEEVLIRELGGTALFAARFRENAGRALLLPKRMPGRRTPLWLQRRRSADLLRVASQFPSFPIMLETYRECLRDVFDIDGLTKLMRDIAARRIAIHVCHSSTASPFARSLLFSYVGNFLYEGDAPLAERKAATLALDHQQLRELLGTADLRSLLDADVIAQLALELQRLDGKWPIRSGDDLQEMLVRLGDMTEAEIRGRVPSDLRSSLAHWLVQLSAQRRVVELQIGGESRWVAAEDASRFRDVQGCQLPPGLPSAFLESAQDPLGDLIGRYARTHVPFTADDVAARLGIGVAMVRGKLSELAGRNRVVSGEFTPGQHGTEWCDANVLKKLKHRCLAKLRQQVEPVDRETLVRFVSHWQSIARPRSGYDGVLDVIEQLQGLPLPATAWEDSILPVRVRDFHSQMLDELCAAGEIVWRGHEPIGESDGRIAFYLTDDFAKLGLPTEPPEDPLEQEFVTRLAEGGPQFFQDLVSATGHFAPDAMRVIWSLVWRGLVSNDTLGPVRMRRQGGGRGTVGTGPQFRSRRDQTRAIGVGRWRLLPEIVATTTEQAVAWARQLIDRHGVLCRESMVLESVPGGFARLYPVLRDLEESGKLRRGYFVEGMGGAQFAAPGAEDQLRQFRHGDRQADSDERHAMILSAVDPASPYGTLLAWPEGAGKPQRAAGAQVFLIDGIVTGYVSKSGRQLLTFGAAASHDHARQSRLAELFAEYAGSRESLTLRKVDDLPVLESPLLPVLEAVGFRRTVGALYFPRRAAERERRFIGRFADD